MLRKSVDGVHEREGLDRAARATQPTAADVKASKQRAAKRASTSRRTIAGLVHAESEGEDQAILARRKIDFPFYFPTLRDDERAPTRAPSRAPTRSATSRRRSHDAYRLVLATGVDRRVLRHPGHDWRDPPILDDPHTTILRNGRKLMVYRDGNRVRLVAWRTRKGVYWVVEHAHAVAGRGSDDRHRRLDEAARR